MSYYDIKDQWKTRRRNIYLMRTAQQLAFWQIAKYLGISKEQAGAIYRRAKREHERGELFDNT